MLRRCEEAYVLGTRPLREADLLVSFLTSEAGKVRAVARSAKKSRRRFGAALEPLTRVRASWTETEGRDLGRLDSCDILTSYVEAQRELPLFYFFAYASEVADLFAREQEPDPRFFRLFAAVLDAAAGGLPVTAARRYLDLWTLRLQGLLPDLSSCSSCGVDPAAERGAGAGECVVDLSEGALLCRECAGLAGAAGVERVRLAPGALRAARFGMRRGPAEAAVLSGPLEGLDSLSRRAMLRFTERPLRTLRFLAEGA